MNQNQRKYATERINQICNAKAKEIATAFDSVETNKPKPILPQQWHTQRDILRALIGLSSPVILKSNLEELIDQNFSAGSPYSTHLAILTQPQNNPLIQENKAYNDAIDVRRKTQVNDRIEALNAAARRAMDTIMLGDEAAALAAVAAFEGFTVT